MNGSFYVKKIAALLVCSAVLTGCQNTVSTENTNEQTMESSAIVDTDTLTEEYTDWKNDHPNYIHLNGNSIEFEGDGATVDDSDIRITAGGTYVIDGTLDDGAIIVDANKEDVRLVLNGVEIHCEDSAAIYVMSAGKTIVSLEPETENKVSDGDTYVFEDESSDEPDAAIFSKDDLIFNGTGTLTVEANYSDGIAGKDDVTIMEGVFQITSADDGIRGKDSLTIKDGSFIIEAGNDGLKSTNSTDEGKGYVVLENGNYTLNCANDGIQAETILQIDDGTYDITTGGGSGEASDIQGIQDMAGMDQGNIERGEMPSGDGRPTDGEMPQMQPGGQMSEGFSEGQTQEVTEDTTESYKGLKAGAQITINGGTYTLDCLDDSIHSNGDITINDGSYTLATGDDGVHADGNLTIENGTINITQSYEGLEGTQVTINDGSIKITASDDGINTAGGSDETEGNGPMGMDNFAANENNIMTINDGEIYINASGDGLDSNGNIIQNGGVIYVDGPTSGGDGALDFNGSYDITGGVLVAAGSSLMAQMPSSVEGSYCVSMTYASFVAGGTEVAIRNVNGDTVFSYTPSKDFNSIIIVSQDIKDGQTYTLYSDDQFVTEFSITDTMTVLAEDGAASGMNGFQPEGMKRPEDGRNGQMQDNNGGDI